jgi:hypothetical protein
MRSALLGLATLAASFVGGCGVLLTTTSTALAQPNVCCTQMKGRWETNPNTGQMQCTGVDRARYNRCVAQKATGQK